MNRNFSKSLHYLTKANPFRTADSLSTLINENLTLTSNKDIAVLNKPPGFILLDKNKDKEGFINILCDNVKRKLNWQHALRVPLVTNDQSGISIFASSRESFELVHKTMYHVFSSNHKPFLTFYAITTFTPLSQKGKEVFHVSYKQVNDDILYFEEKKVSINQAKRNKIITYQIEHEVVSSNPELNVSLVKFHTTYHNGDGILVYCIKNLCPILGDHRYSSRVQTLFGKPVLAKEADVIHLKPQVLRSNVKKALNLDDTLVKGVPLHLHLREINLDRSFKKQKIEFKNQVSFWPSFKETLTRLSLSLPQELI